MPRRQHEQIRRIDQGQDLRPRQVAGEADGGAQPEPLAQGLELGAAPAAAGQREAAWETGGTELGQGLQERVEPLVELLHRPDRDQVEGRIGPRRRRLRHKEGGRQLDARVGGAEGAARGRIAALQLALGDVGDGDRAPAQPGHRPLAGRGQHGAEPGRDGVGGEGLDREADRLDGEGLARERQQRPMMIERKPGARRMKAPSSAQQRPAAASRPGKARPRPLGPT